MAVWMTDGWDAVLRYRDQRREEVKKLKMENIACFHDTSSMLECVKKAHLEIALMTNSGNHVTTLVFRCLLEHMLHPDGEARITSEKLRQKTNGISNTAQRRINAGRPSQGRMAVSEDDLQEVDNHNWEGQRLRQVPQSESTRKLGQCSHFRTRHTLW